MLLIIMSMDYPLKITDKVYHLVLHFLQRTSNALLCKLRRKLKERQYGCQAAYDLTLGLYGLMISLEEVRLLQ
jgi:hypothetical protein